VPNKNEPFRLNTSGYTKNILRHHASRNQVKTKVFSEGSVFNTTYTIHLHDEEYEIEDIRGFIAFEYD
jgi:hypothetical protein